MEIVVPFNDFSSTSSSPYVSAPSSPKRFGDPFDYYYHYTSAPTSPTQVAAILAADRYDWEVDKSVDCGAGSCNNNNDLDDFAFDFSGQLEKGRLPPDLTTADVLFEEGKIRPLNRTSVASTPRGVEATRERGRDRGHTTLSIPSSKSRKGSRSLSPMRSGVGSFFQKAANSVTTTTAAATKTTSVADTGATECLKSSSGSRKWRLRDLFLFRSASEGRATGNKSKDPLRKFTVAPSSPAISAKSGGVDSRNSSFRSADGSVGRSTRKGRVSAHEMHYTSNRVASEGMRRKTALPFNGQGLFGCLRFNPAVNSIAKGFAR